MRPKQNSRHWVLATFVALLVTAGGDRAPSAATITAPPPAPRDRVEADVVRIVSEQMGVRVGTPPGDPS